jgi:hypothetical protein
MPMNLISIIVAISFLGPAQSKGVYRFQIDGKLAGHERFEVMKSETGYTAKSMSESSVGGTLHKIATSTEIQNDKPVRYTVETGDGATAQKYSMEFKEGSVSVTIEAHGKKTERKRVVGRDVVLLDRGVWHHLRFLLERYDMKAGGYQRFKAFIPLSGLREYSVDVRLIEKKEFKMGQVKRRGDLFSVILAETYEMLVIADEARAPLMIEIPLEKTKIVLE